MIIQHCKWLYFDSIVLNLIITFLQLRLYFVLISLSIV